MAVTVKVQGLSQLGAAFDELSKGVARNTGKRTLVKAGQITADRASALAPDDPHSGPPDLHRSIAVGTKLTPRQSRLHKKSPDKSFAEAFVGVTEDANAYAHLVEFGTVNTAPQPFMRPAWDATKDQVLDSIKKDLGNEIEKSAARARARALKKAS